MSSYRKKLQSNTKITNVRDHLPGQNFNILRLRYYSQQQAWNFLRSFDRTPTIIRQNRLENNKNRLNCLLTLPYTV